MKRTLVLLAVLTVSIATVATPVFAQPQEPTTLTEQQRDTLSVTCASVQQTMRRVHTADAGVYVSRNQVHYTISDKLMARLNARVVANRLDGGQLVSAAARHSAALGSFRTSYRAYETQLDATIRMKCSTQPQKFYNEVVKTQQLRSATHESVMTLQARLSEYSQAFDVFYDREVHGVQPEVEPGAEEKGVGQ